MTPTNFRPAGKSTEASKGTGKTKSGRKPSSSGEDNSDPDSDPQGPETPPKDIWKPIETPLIQRNIVESGLSTRLLLLENLKLKGEENYIP